jgi:hypothetical protein
LTSFLKLSERLEPPTSEWIITESKCAYYASCFDDLGATDGLITVEEAIEKFHFKNARGLVWVA